MSCNKWISVLVSCYNQENFILECLESIKKQSFKNFQIVVADDFSSDNSISRISNWIDKNAGLDIVLVTASENKGVSANFQRGLEFCTGEWIKVIAADDILRPDCLMTLSNCKGSLNNFDIVYSKSTYFYEKKELFTFPNYNQINFTSHSRLLEYIYYDNFINVPTLFFRRAKLCEIGGFVTQYRNIEDYPTILKMVLNGSFVKFIDNETVLYRVTNNSLSNYREGGNRVNYSFFLSYLNFYNQQLKPFHESRKNYMFYYVSDLKYYLLQMHLKFNNYALKIIFYKLSALCSKFLSFYCYFVLKNYKVFKR